MLVAKIPTVKCTGAHRHFSSNTMNYSNVTINYSNAIFCVRDWIRLGVERNVWASLIVFSFYSLESNLEHDAKGWIERWCLSTATYNSALAPEWRVAKRPGVPKGCITLHIQFHSKVVNFQNFFLVHYNFFKFLNLVKIKCTERKENCSEKKENRKKNWTNLIKKYLFQIRIQIYWEATRNFYLKRIKFSCWCWMNSKNILSLSNTNFERK